MKKYSIFILPFFILNAIFFGCSSDDPKPKTGKLTGKVTDIVTSAALADVKVIVFNADDNAPTGNTLMTDANGAFSTSLTPGNYFLKFYKQGYDAIPPSGIEAVAFSIEAGSSSDQSAEMYPSVITNAGFISGKVTASAAVPGVLIVAEDAENGRAYSSVSDDDGGYEIYNVPAGTYSVKAYAAGHSSNTISASVTDNIETADINIVLTAGASGKLSGSVRNLATGNKDVDVSLVHPITKETIPGLSTHTTNLMYSISNIPDGTYIARATFKNDERVMDPDRIAKFGEPVVTFSGNTIDLTFDITSAVSISTPTNEASSTEPVEVNSTAPTFTWLPYSSTSDYVIEVTDASTGVVVWGGFDKSGALPVKMIVIPSSQKSIQFNSDGNATISQLTPGKIYRWRIFASKNDQNSTTGWTLISASEDQLGLVKIVQ
jgi:hypothetical protein